VYTPKASTRKIKIRSVIKTLTETTRLDTLVIEKLDSAQSGLEEPAASLVLNAIRECKRSRIQTIGAIEALNKL
jgi:hypothetical protein